MADHQSLRGTLDLLVLGVLSRSRRLTGYAIQQAIEEASKGKLRIKDSSLYPALERMEEAGWVVPTRGDKWGRSRSKWHLSPEGREQYVAEKLRWGQFRSAVNSVLRRRA